MFSPLSNPTFRTLWLVTLVSNLGSLMQVVGAAWLMTSLTTSHWQVALVQSSNTLPVMVFSLLAGVLADSFDRRRIMIMAQLAMLAVSIALALAAWAGVLTPWSLLAFTFLIGCGTALNNPSWQASLGEIVGREGLPAAVGLNAVGFNITRSIGPALGGLITALGGAFAAFLANALSYLPLSIALLRWKPDVPPRQMPRERMGAALGDGLRYVALSPQLLRIMLRAFFFGACAIAPMALLPLVTRDTLNGSAMSYGILFGTFGLGAVGGAAISARLRARMSNERVVQLSFVGTAIGGAGLGLAGSIPVGALAMVLAGICWVLALALFNVSVQLAVPRWVLGRALSCYQMFSFGGMALGAWAWGTVADLHGTTTALVAAAGLGLVGALLGVVLRIPAFSTRDLDPSNNFRAPAPQLDVLGRSGPVQVQIRYRIAIEDTETFLTLMRDRKRIRRRDGAHRWTLLRDIEAPDIWEESYVVPTWDDYLRHNLRRTKADVGNQQAVLALDRSDRAEAGRVRRFIERPTTTVREDRLARLSDIGFPGG